MAVVKADGYGHGIVEAGCARPVPAAPAGWASPCSSEALELRAAGDTGPILSLAGGPGRALRPRPSPPGRAVGIHRRRARRHRRSRPAIAGARAAVQLKLDSGLGRGGAHPDDWPALVDAAVVLRRRRAPSRSPACGRTWRAPTSRITRRSRRRLAEFEAGVAVRRRRRDSSRAHVHLANSGGVLAMPEHLVHDGAPGHRDLRRLAVRRRHSPGAAAPGDDPARPTRAGQAASMPARASPTGTPTSPTARHPWPSCRSATATASRATPRAGPGAARRTSVHRIAGRVCMDQFVVDLGEPRRPRRATRWCCSATRDRR